MTLTPRGRALALLAGTVAYCTFWVALGTFVASVEGWRR